MARRLSSVVPFLLAASLCLFAAPAALAATTPTINFGHDDSLDDPSEPDTGTNDAGTTEVHSGLFAAFNYDATLQPDAQRADSVASANALGPGTPPNTHPEFVPEDNPTYEKFPFTVPAGDQNGSFTVTVTWEEPAIDFDVYVYRQRGNGTLDPQPVAQAASSADPERATRFEAIAGDPIHAGTYWVYVDNWCSNDHDPLIQRFFGGFCIDEDNPLTNSDEDDFIGQVTFTPFVVDNKLPSVSLTGPDAGKTNTDLTFAAAGSDPDGSISQYAFDLDGDGRFEYDNGKNGTVTARFPNAGRLQRRRPRGRRPRRRRLRQQAGHDQRAVQRHDRQGPDPRQVVQAQPPGVRRPQERQARGQLQAARGGQGDPLAVSRQEAGQAPVDRQPQGQQDLQGPHQAEEAQEGRDLHRAPERHQRRRQAHAEGAAVGQAPLTRDSVGGAAG